MDRPQGSVCRTCGQWGDTGPPAPGRVAPSGPSPTPEGRTPAARTRGPPQPPGCPDPSITASAHGVLAVWGHGPSEGWYQDTVKSSLWLLPAALLNLDSPWGPCDLSWGRTPRPPGYGVRDPPSRSCPGGDAGGAPGRVLQDRPGSWVPRSAEHGAVWTCACWLRVPRWPSRQRWPSSWELCSRTQSRGADSGGCFCLGRLPWLGGPAAGRYLQPLFGPVAMAALVCFDVTMC